MLVSVSMGGLLANSNTQESSPDFNTKYNILLKLMYILVLPVFIYLIYISSKLILQHGFWGYMYITRFQIGVEGMGRDAIFGTGYFRIIFNMIIDPILTASYYIGLAHFFLYNKKRLFFFSALLMMVYGVIMTAVGNFLTITITVFFSSLLVIVNRKMFEIDLYLRVKKYGARIIIIGLVLVMVMSFQRNQSLGFSQILLKYGVGYHTLGFTMLDKELLDENSYLNQNITFGRAIFGLPDQLLEIISRRIDKEGLRSISRELVAMQDEWIHVGYYDWGYGLEPIESNAFYTILYYLYLDGRIFGVVIIPILYGYFLMSFYLKWKKNNNAYFFTMIVFLFMIGFNALKMPMVIRQFFWPTFILIWAFGNVKIPFIIKNSLKNPFQKV
jgi:oligosaccharide repeat unit polymerase